MINFKAKSEKINNWTIIRLPKDSSLKLPSRGQVMVKGKINGVNFQDALEPDGNGSHWINITEKIQTEANIKLGTEAEISIEATKDWPEPQIPSDIQKGVATHPETKDLWDKVTPMARWEWIRWISSTNNPDTRKKRIVVSRSKLQNGLRRPCCFNRSMCCVPDVSKSGVLIGAL